MIVKVCGMRDAENIRQVEALGIQLMGFIFWPKSVRYVSRRPNYLPCLAKRVGVFVDEDADQVVRLADDYGLDYIQLHGHESPDYCARLTAKFRDAHPAGGDATIPSVIKAFSIATAADIAQTDAYEGVASCFLFDTKGKSVGGNGEKFNWDVLHSYHGTTPFLLSGGIGPDDGDRIRQLFTADNGIIAEKCMGIDLNSRFESAPAIKDVALLRHFLSQLINNQLFHYEQDKRTLRKQ